MFLYVWVCRDIFIYCEYVFVLLALKMLLTIFTQFFRGLRSFEEPIKVNLLLTLRDLKNFKCVLGFFFKLFASLKLARCIYLAYIHILALGS